MEALVTVARIGVAQADTPDLEPVAEDVGGGVEHDVVPPADSKDRIAVIGHGSAGPQLVLPWWRALGGQPLELRAQTRYLLATQQSRHDDIADFVEDRELLRGR